MNARGFCSRFIFAAVVLMTLPMSGTLFAQPSAGDGSRVGVPVVGNRGIQETVEQIMAREAVTPRRLTTRIKPEHTRDRQDLPQNPLSPNDAQSPPGAQIPRISGPLAPQTVGTSFTGATLADTGAFPPDTMGAAGPTQFIVAVNGRIRSFNKSTGVADGVLNVDPDVFFASVMTPPGMNEVTFTSDPRIRYDRLTARWFIDIIDVILNPGTGATTKPNRVLLAVSDATSAGVITSGTVWTFFFFGDATNFTDYDTLGIDVNALYIGANMFSLAGSFVGTNGYVVRKSSILGAGPIVLTPFANLTGTTTGPGPWTPQGVDNLYDAAATEGYFIGVDNATFSTLMLRRVSDPGGTPTISGNISITVNTTTLPTPVPHLGGTGGTGGRLDALDDRLFAAQMRGGNIWTAHNIQVNSSGVASTTGGRDGTRWYELQNIVSPGTPSFRQSGTVFDSAATNPLSYWIPSIAVSGQGHAALGFSVAGAAARIDAATVGRLSGDTLATMQGPPVLYTTSATAYNPPGDPGGAGGRRWGDYSYTSLDPNDDMTLWTIQQFCDATNSYGVRVAKLVAPPPATPDCTVPSLVTTPTQNVTITGISTGGSGFFDPGSGFPNRLQASVSGGVTVNSVTYNTPTSVTLNITATTNGLKNVTFTNPDGQNVAGSNCISVTLPPAAARVFLSGTGSDLGDCLSAATPCRSLQGAIDQAPTGGEVVVVSSGGYGGATITKSITVSAPTGVIAFVGRTITVSIASTDTVTLRGLSMNGAVFGDAMGIDFLAGGTLNIENSVIASFAMNGVNDRAAGSSLWAHNCDFKKNFNGIYVQGASAVIENSRAVENFQIGMWADNSSTVAIRNSVAEGNGTGFYANSDAGGSTELTVDSCMSTNNGYGLYSNQSGPGSVATLRAGKNIVMNNTNANLATSGGSGMISQGGNRIGGATGGTTGFTGTVGQQ